MSDAALAGGYRRYAPYDSFITDQVALYDLPQEFRFLPLLLTDCNPRFMNEYAGGAWALPAAVAHRYDMVLRPDYDARRDMVAATKVAVAYLADLYYRYDCDAEQTLWHYIERTRPVSRRSEDVRLVLERLGQEYEAAAMAYPADTLQPVVMEYTIRLGDLCRLTAMDSLLLLDGNPAIHPKARLLHKGSRVYFPASAMALYDAAADSLRFCAVDTKAGQVLLPTQRPRPKPAYVVYRVRQGDTLGHIAMRYHVGVSQLKRWNRLRSDLLQIGQKLKIYR